MNEQNIDVSSECAFTTSRSSGPGGQHVNKTETRVELKFNISESAILEPRQKEILIKKLANRLINDQTTIHISVQVTRSQLKNKTIAITKLHDLITDALEPEVPRVPTKPSKASVQKRKEDKKSMAMLKASRGNFINKRWVE